MPLLPPFSFYIHGPCVVSALCLFGLVAVVVDLCVVLFMMYSAVSHMTAELECGVLHAVL